MADRETTIKVLGRLRDSGISDDIIKSRLSGLGEAARNSEIDKLAKKFNIPQRPQPTRVEQAREQIQREEIGFLGAVGRGMTEEILPGSASVVRGLVRGAIPGGSDTLEAIEQEKAIGTALQEDRPIATTIGRAIGFGVGFPGAVARQGLKQTLKFIPKLSGESFKRLWTRSILEGAASFGAAGALHGAATGFVEGATQDGKGIIPETVRGATTGLTEGAVGGAISGGILPIAIKTIQSAKKLLPEDIRTQLANPGIISRIRKEGSAQVFAKGEKRIAEAANQAIDGYNATIKKTADAITLGLKNLSDDNQQVKTNAAKILVRGLDGATQSIKDNYAKAINPILEDAKKSGLSVDMRAVRKKVASILLDNGGVTHTGEVLLSSDYARQNPKQFNTLVDIFNRLSGTKALKRGDLNIPITRPLKDAIFMKRELGLKSNFARPADSVTGALRVVYQEARKSIELADDRISPANQAFADAKGKLDDLLQLIPRKDTSFESFVNTVSSENKQILTETLKSFKGKINDDVDAAIDKALQFSARKAKLKAVGGVTKDFSDVKALGSVIELLPQLANDVNQAALSQKNVKLLQDSLGRVVGKSNVEKFLRNIDAMKQTGGLNRIEIFENAVRDLGLEDVLIRASAGRAVERLFTPINNAVQHAAQGVVTGNPKTGIVEIISRSGTKAAASVIDSLYRATDTKVLEILKKSPSVIRMVAETRGPRFALVLWLSTKNGDQEVAAALDRVNTENEINSEDHETRRLGIKDTVDKAIHEAAVNAQLD